MREALGAILLCGIAVAACEPRESPKPPEPPTAEAAASDVDIRADIESGEVKLRLPGGVAGTVRLPEGLAESKFDLDGIGRYPGAKLTTVDVKASDSDGAHEARVVLGFTAPGRPEQVADWYERALVRQGRSAARSGTTITGTTSDGNPMVIAISPGDAGTAQGRITIIDSDG
ncbi:hypothetical protein [Sandarakinorhabdus rubra]|uniref:hypothetical protein n=1 Tax=Sandarakinorhabdus rubra TaxID=2672568 RepID=UPI0013DD0640|nr:hypothetical protein [Sandarakinorhabdus rubra]